MIAMIDCLAVWSTMRNNSWPLWFCQQKLCILHSRIAENIKTGKHYGCLELRAYDDDKELCVVTFLQEYVKRTVKFRGNKAQLLLNYNKPHNPVSTKTIGGWLKEVLKQSWN